MGYITVNITNIDLPATIELVPEAGILYNVETLGIHTIEDIPEGQYNIVVLDSNGCSWISDLVCVVDETTTTTTTTEQEETTTTTTTTQGITPVEYGVLYNWYAATDVRKITSSDDWIVPTYATLGAANGEFYTLGEYIGGQLAEEKLNESGTEHWTVGNGTNETGFNGRGAGRRNEGTGTFVNLKTGAEMWTDRSYSTSMAVSAALSESAFTYPRVSTYPGAPKERGISIRLVYTGAGTPTTYTGNDGKVYPVVLIGTQYWLAANLNETKYRNGDWITGFDGGVYTPISDVAWAALTTEAMCYYNDDENNG